MSENVKPKTEKICKDCNSVQPVDQFYIAYIAKNGNPVYSAKCKKHAAENTKKRELEKKDQYATMRRRYALRRTEERRNGINRSRYLLKDYKCVDKQYGRAPCDLTEDYINDLIQHGCFYCGEKDIKLIGLDRINNTIGHMQGNVNSCCRKCNWLKRDLPYEAWLFILPRIKKAIKLGLLDNWNPGIIKNDLKKKHKSKNTNKIIKVTDQEIKNYQDDTIYILGLNGPRDLFILNKLHWPEEDFIKLIIIPLINNLIIEEINTENDPDIYTSKRMFLLKRPTEYQGEF